MAVIISSNFDERAQRQKVSQHKFANFVTMMRAWTESQHTLKRSAGTFGSQRSACIGSAGAVAATAGELNYSV